MRTSGQHRQGEQNTDNSENPSIPHDGHLSLVSRVGSELIRELLHGLIHKPLMKQMRWPIEEITTVISLLTKWVDLRSRRAKIIEQLDNSGTRPDVDRR